jgi:hypothetical protein
MILFREPSVMVASVMQLAGHLVMAYVLAWLMISLNYHSAAEGLKTALLIWLGFVAAVIGPMYAFQAFSLQFFLLQPDMF